MARYVSLPFDIASSGSALPLPEMMFRTTSAMSSGILLLARKLISMRHKLES